LIVSSTLVAKYTQFATELSKAQVANPNRALMQSEITVARRIGDSL
jgi:hypothetical protein